MHPKKADLLERLRDCEVASMRMIEESLAYFCGGYTKMPDFDATDAIFRPIRTEYALHYSRILDMPDEQFDAKLEVPVMVASFSEKVAN